MRSIFFKIIDFYFQYVKMMNERKQQFVSLIPQHFFLLFYQNSKVKKIELLVVNLIKLAFKFFIFRDGIQIFFKIMQGVSIAKNAFKLLIIRTTENYGLQGFDYHLTLNSVFQETLQNCQKQRDTKKNINQEKMKTELTTFLEMIRQFPKHLIDTILREPKSLPQTNIILNEDRHIKKVYLKLLEQIDEVFEDSEYFEEKYLDNQNKMLLAQLINKIAECFIQCYQQAKSFVNSQIQEIKNLAQELILSQYFLFALLKQIHSATSSQMKEILSTQMFRYLDQKSRERINKFVMKNFQNVNIICSENYSINIQDFNEERSKQKQRKLFWKKLFLNHEKLKIKKAQSPQRQKGLFIQQEKENQIDERFILNLVDNTIITVNSSIFSDWNVYSKEETIEKCLQLIEEKELQVIIQAQKLVSHFHFQSAATVGGVLGQCLADIDEYKSAGEFLKDFSKKTIVSSSMNIVFEEVPILCLFFMLGSFSYAFYNIYNCKVTDTTKKLKEIGRISLTAFSLVGASITGAILCQILIPIPLVGTFFGGFLGGYLGEMASKTIAHEFDNKHFLKVIKYLKRRIKNHRYWKYDEYLLRLMGVSVKQFNRTNPSKKSCSDEWMTAIAFNIVCFYESKERAKAINQSKRQSDHSMTNESSSIIFTQTFQILNIYEYLQKKGVNLIRNSKEISELTKPLLENLS